MEVPNLADVVQSLELAVFRREAVGALRLVGMAPAWMEAVWPSVARSGLMDSVIEVSPYLDNFLIDAEAHWKSGKPEHAHSGPWVETTADGRECNLEATAMNVGGVATLVIDDLGENFEQRRAMLQTARENMLAYEKLNTEVQRKEVLLHCIVHDMCSPLQNMMMALSMLDSEILAPEVRGMVQLGLQAGRRQEAMIDNVLHMYANEMGAHFCQESGEWPGIDLRGATQRTVDLHRPLFAQQNVTLSWDRSTAGKGRQRFAGDESHFERVLGNLLGNALRHSPTGGTVGIRFEQDPEWMSVMVEDEGSGVSPHVQAQLFQKFQQGAVGRGKVGLGLYFCRIIVSKWGGEIGFTPREGGGSQFWFKLPALPPAKTSEPAGSRS
jgi:signal transduction histidine kinase